MTFSPFRLRSAALSIAFFTAQAQAASLSEGWKELAAMKFEEAHQIFAAAEGREARLGEAIALLQLQPKTTRKIDLAFTLLETLCAENESDETGIQARYYLARIEHVHRIEPDPAAAAIHYRILRERHAGHPLADLATVKLAILELYTPEKPVVRREVYARYEALAKELRSGAARRDLELLLGDTALRMKLGDEQALRHYIEADRAGISLASTRGNTWVAIGELARGLGDAATAASYYRRFLAEFTHDNRRLLVTEHLAMLSDGSVTLSR